MSPLGQAISNWLHSFPGTFTHDTYDGCLQQAFEDIGLARYGVTVDDFREALNRAGYQPQERTRFGQKEGESKHYWALVLPEGSHSHRPLP